MRFGKSCISMIFAVAFVVVAVSAPVQACEFCTPQVTIADQIFKVDASVLTVRIGGEKPATDSKGSTTFRITRVLHTGEARRKAAPPKVGDNVHIDGHIAAKPGAIYIISSLGTDKFVWGQPLEISKETLSYALEAPGVDSPLPGQLRYYVRFLESPNTKIAQDAYAHFSSAPYDDVAAIKDAFPREKLRGWLNAEKVPKLRLGLYGLMLGLCGNETDARLLEQKIAAKTDGFRFGLGGIMGGYMLMRGETGLRFIEQTKLESSDVPIDEVLSVTQALRFMWTQGAGRISKDRLKAAMRPLIDRPAVADMVITDLARWKDWTVMDRLVKLYGTEDYDSASTKQRIAKFLIACTKDVPKNGDAKLPPHAARAKRHQEDLRKKDPKTISLAERFF